MGHYFSELPDDVQDHIRAQGRQPGAVIKYIYSFVVWPDETCDFTQSLFRYFRTFRRRTEMHFTESQFVEFRTDLLHDGFTLREVTRRPIDSDEQVP